MINLTKRRVHVLSTHFGLPSILILYYTFYEQCEFIIMIILK